MRSSWKLCIIYILYQSTVSASRIRGRDNVPTIETTATGIDNPIFTQPSLLPESTIAVTTVVAAPSVASPSLPPSSNNKPPPNRPPTTENTATAVNTPNLPVESPTPTQVPNGGGLGSGGYETCSAACGGQHLIPHTETTQTDLEFPVAPPATALPQSQAPAAPTEGNPAIVKPAPIKPAPINPAPVIPAPVIPAPVIPAPVIPAPVNPAPVNPAPVNPAPVNPAPVNPAPVNPAPVNPAPINPAPANPAPINAVPGNSAPVAPNPSPIQPTDSLASLIASVFKITDSGAPPAQTPGTPPNVQSPAAAPAPVAPQPKPAPTPLSNPSSPNTIPQVETPAHNPAVIPSDTPLKAPLPGVQVNSPPPAIAVGSSLITADSSSNYVLPGGQTLIPGGPAIVVSPNAIPGQGSSPVTLSLAPSASALVQGTITQALTPAAPSPTAPLIGFGSSYISANPSGEYILPDGQTLSGGGSAIVLTEPGTAPGAPSSLLTVSLASANSAIVIGSVTHALALPDSGTITSNGVVGSEITEAPAISVGGTAVSANLLGDYVLPDGQTLVPGGSAVVVSGTTLSLQSGDKGLVVGNSTQKLHPTTTFLTASIMSSFNSSSNSSTSSSSNSNSGFGTLTTPSSTTAAGAASPTASKKGTASSTKWMTGGERWWLWGISTICIMWVAM